MISAQCPNCLFLALTGNDLGQVICAAFPSGIPEEIVTGAFDHTRPYPGDNGIRYLPSARWKQDENNRGKVPISNEGEDVRGMIASADGYRDGWVVAQSAGWPCGATPDLRLCGTFLDVIDATKGCDILVVDMPIGLPDQGCRACDDLGRKELGTAGQPRVFYAPPRPALAAQDWDQFKQLHRQANGRGLSKQVYGLCIKLLDVDGVMTPSRQSRIMEFHPELAWARLGGAILPSKHTAAGILARLRLLRPCVPGIDVIDTVHVEASASPGIDDLLDAVVGLCVAAGIVAKLSPPYRLPVQNPPVDSKGLRMEIWY